MNNTSFEGPPPLPPKNNTPQEVGGVSQGREINEALDSFVTNQPTNQPVPTVPSQMIHSFPVVHATEVITKKPSVLPVLIGAVMVSILAFVGCVVLVIIMWPRPEPMLVPHAIGNNSFPPMFTPVPPKGIGSIPSFPPPQFSGNMIRPRETFPDPIRKPGGTPQPKDLFPK